MKSVCLVFASVATACAHAAEPPKTVKILDKKVIEYGWDVPFPSFIREHIREMEKRPFDGLIFKLKGGGKVLTPKAWPESQFAQDYEDLRNIEWRRFTDNFVILWAASDQDWFNDDHWKAIANNVRLVARAARIGRCVGVCFDQEPYGTNPWNYRDAAHSKTKGFAEYQAKVRQRGAEFVRALQAEMPNPKILTFFQTSFLWRLLVPMDPAERLDKLSRHYYGLLPAFLCGMLDGAEGETTIIDGNEHAYYYTNSREHLRAYWRISQQAKYLVDPGLWETYRRRVRVGQALYIDQYYGMRKNKVLGHYMKPEEQSKWFEHNAYWALQTTDEYVWCYSERMNWWADKDVPAGCEDALRSARAKYAKGAPLGHDIQPIIEAAERRRQQVLNDQLKTRRAEIPRLGRAIPPPEIDGDLSDPAWKEARTLDPFVPMASEPDRQVQQTHARVLYDKDALYIALRCDEPNPERMNVHGIEHDDHVWYGDDVELMITTPERLRPFFHFMINPEGVTWDAISEHPVRKYNPDWYRAVKIREDHWTVEIALPWEALGVASPKSGTVFRANICRQRTQNDREWSAWSQMANGFLEADRFGTWVLE